MDFYSNEMITRVETKRRLTELHRNSVRAPARNASEAPERRDWTREFIAWVAARAAAGRTWMARTPQSP
jgi:hypothetical protein